jgi:pantothenate kinase
VPSPLPHSSTGDALAAIRERGVSGRVIVAVAGPPGSGKSTFAARIVEALNAGEPGAAALLAMDGFHFDNTVLLERGLRPRKGAPQTFDVGGLEHCLFRLRRNTEEEIAVPVFDRAIEVARAGAAIIPRSAKYVVVEGNYLLLDQQPWTRLAQYFDLTIFLDVDDPVLRERLVRRWQEFGYDEERQRAKLDGNDLPNVALVKSRSRIADFVIANC